MEEIDSSVNEKSNILERSYCRGVKRIAHQKNSSFFQLPNNVIKKRQRAWSKLFDKYDKEVDDYEIKMYNLGSDVDEDDKEIEKKSNQDADDVDEKDYFVKNRTPIRKIPALVQYWVDTGNPPFQLNLENDESESSLSEEQKSSPLIIHIQSETEGKRDHSTSFLSSVDTAAYILSNTNVTTKADTLAIVEGAKKSDSPIEANNIILNASKECTSTNHVSNIPDKDNYNNHNITSGRTSIYYMNGENITAIKSHLLTALDPDNIKNKKLISSESCDKSLDKLIMQTSVKITDVLPTLEQLDKTLNGNTSDIDELSNIISLKDSRKSISSQPLSRKKLYTNRESPIDLIISNSKNNFKPRFSTNILHPALQSTPTINASRSYFRRRALRYSRKRKSIASNQFKRVSDKNYLNSPRTRKSSRKHSSAKSLSNSNHDITDNMNNSVESNNDDQLENNKKEEDLVALCKKKNLFVRLEKIPDDQLTIENIKVKDIESTLNSSNNYSVKTINSNTKISASYSVILDLDFQESDQSTIIICECNYKSSSLSQQGSQTCSDNELMHSEDEHNEKSKKWSKQNIEKSTELLNEELQNINGRVSLEENKKIVVDDDDFSDVFVGKFNKVANSSVLSEISALSNMKEKMSPKINKSKKTEVNVQSPSSQKSNNSGNSEDLSWKLRLTFSSDEEDDFIQMIRRKTEISKFRQTQIEDKSVEGANKTEQALNNYKNESNFPRKFGVIASSDDDEKKIIKVDNISKQIRKSIRIHSRNKNSITESSSDDKVVKIETTSKQKRKSTNFRSKKFNKHSGKASVKNISPQHNTRKRTSHVNVKLYYSNLDSSSENTTPPKKLKTTPDDASNGNKKQAMNDTNLTNETMVSLKEDFSLNKKNLNDLIKRNSPVKPDQTFQSKRQRSSNHEKDRNISRNGDHENKCSPKGHIPTKKCSIPIVKYLNPSEDVVDSGLSSIVSSNGKISKKISDEKLSCSDDLKSISPLEKRHRNSPKSLKRKFSISTRIQQSSSKSVKKLTKKHKSILVSDESDSENDLNPRTHRQSAINKSNLSNPTNTREEKNFDTIFPDPINDLNVLEMTVFSSRSRRSRNQNAKRNHMNQTSSNSKLRNGKIKFHTGMCSDSD